MTEFAPTQILINVDISQVSEAEARSQVEAIAACLGGLAGDSTVQLRRHIAGVEVPQHDLLIMPAGYVVTPKPDETPFEKCIYRDLDHIFIPEKHSMYADGLVLPFTPHAIKMALKAISLIPADERGIRIGDLYARGYAGMASTDMIGAKSFGLILAGLSRLALPPLAAQVTMQQRKTIQDYLDRACA